jgi:hypothetical protein
MLKNVADAADQNPTVLVDGDTAAEVIRIVRLVGPEHGMGKRPRLSGNWSG